MPTSAPRPCTYPGCSALTSAGRCDEHKRIDTGAFGDTRRGTRQERGYGAEWDRQRARILRRDDGICQPCLKVGFVHVGDQVDHVVPKFEGGTDDDSNLQAINHDCHKRKTQAEALRARGLTPTPVES